MINGKGCGKAAAGSDLQELRMKKEDHRLGSCSHHKQTLKAERAMGHKSREEKFCCG
jgi:hypothetical protein